MFFKKKIEINKNKLFFYYLIIILIVMIMFKLNFFYLIQFNNVIRYITKIYKYDKNCYNKNNITKIYNYDKICDNNNIINNTANNNFSYKKYNNILKKENGYNIDKNDNNILKAGINIGNGYITLSKCIFNSRRTGNLLFVMSTLIFAAKITNREPLIPPYKNGWVDNIFDFKIKQVTNKSWFNSLKSIQIGEKRYSRNSFEIFTEEILNVSQNIKLIKICGYYQNYKYPQSFPNNFKKHFSFKQKTIKQVQEYKSKILEKIKNTHKNKTILTIGLHERRGDFVGLQHKGFVVAKEEYLIKALKYFLEENNFIKIFKKNEERYKFSLEEVMKINKRMKKKTNKNLLELKNNNDFSKKIQNNLSLNPNNNNNETELLMTTNNFHFVVFVVSEDIKWVNKTLGKNFNNFTNVSFFYSKQSIAFDLLLSSSNNFTVISTGTFSWWVGWLSNSTVIYCSCYPGGKIKKYVFHTEYYPSWWIPMTN